MCCITAIWPGLVFYCYIYLIFIRTKKKREKGGLQTWQSGCWEMSWLGDHAANDNWRAWCEEKEHWGSRVREEGQRTRSTSQTRVKERQQRHPEMQEWASEKATFPRLVLDQMKRKLQKKLKVYILVIEENPPRTCVISFWQILLKCYECTEC